MKIKLAQIKSKLSKNNLDKHISIIESSKKEYDLIIFPELSLNGYLLQDLVFENAFEINELNIFKALSKDIDILLGVALRDGAKIYNSAIYFSKGEILHIHNKIHLPNYGLFEEGRFFFKGNEFNTFNTKFGKSVIFICEDLWSGDAFKFLSSNSPDIVFVLSASPAREFNNNGLLIKENWYSLLKTSSILSGAYTVFVNKVGFEDGLGFWGGSSIISPKGFIEKEAKLFEEDFIDTKLDKKLSLNVKYFIRKDNIL